MILVAPTRGIERCFTQTGQAARFVPFFYMGASFCQELVVRAGEGVDPWMDLPSSSTP